MKKQIMISVLIAIVFVVILGVVLCKPPLSTITTSELDAIYGVGEFRIEQIQEFIIEHPNAKVEDLRSIKGVDDMIIKQLEKRFR